MKTQSTSSLPVKQKASEPALSIKQLMLEGLLYSTITFILVFTILRAVDSIDSIFHQKWLGWFIGHIRIVIIVKWLTIVLITASIFAILKIGKHPKQVFLRTTLVGLVCAIIIVFSFWIVLHTYVSLDDIFFSTLKLMRWSSSSRHFNEIIFSFASIFFVGYPILFMGVKYLLNRFLWSQKEEEETKPSPSDTYLV